MSCEEKKNMNDPTQPVPVSFRKSFRYWVKLGFINFGGPAGQIAMMHQELVDRKRWIPEHLFMRALNFCMLLPGPEAQQLATYIGWRMHGIWGGLVAGAFFVFPSIFLMMLLSWLAAAHHQVPAVAGLLYGIQPIVLGIVLEALLRIGKRALHHPALVFYAASTFAALYFLSVPFPAIIALAGLTATLLQPSWPHVFRPRGHGAAPETAVGPAAYPPLGRFFKVTFIFALLWIVPVGTLWLWRGFNDVLTQEATFFTKTAFITFGGAYAVLSYISDVSVNVYHWLAPAQMVQGLGLAESTPGPLIMVTQYVGFLGAWQSHGSSSPLLYGIAGGLITVYVTFLPCFYFIFAGAPYIEAIAHNKKIQAALVGVTSAVVGVILNLAVYFGTKVLVPMAGTWDFFALGMAGISFLVLWRFKIPMYVLVPVGAVAGMAWKLWIAAG